MITNKKVIDWADQKGIARDYEVAVPYVVNGYLFSVAVVSNSVFVKVVLDSEVPKEDVKMLRKELKQFKVLGLTMARRGKSENYSVLMATMGRITSEAIDGTINFLASFLTQRNMAPAFICKFCGNTGCDTYAEDMKSSSALPAHAECNRVEGEKLATEANKNRNAGGIVRGIIGALVGTVVALIVLVVVTIAVNWIHSIELIIIPLFAALFAKWFRGSMKAVTMVFVVIFSLLGTAAFLLLLNYDGSFQNIEFGIYSIITYVFGVLAAIGIIRSAGEGKQNQAKTLIRDAEIAMNNRRAIPATAPAVDLGMSPAQPLESSAVNTTSEENFSSENQAYIVNEGRDNPQV